MVHVTQFGMFFLTKPKDMNNYDHEDKFLTKNTLDYPSLRKYVMNGVFNQTSQNCLKTVAKVKSQEVKIKAVFGLTFCFEMVL